MGQLKVTRDNLGQAVDSTLSRVRSELAKTSPDSAALINDLQMAQKALEGIRQELHGGPQRPKGQRSGLFTRYVIDEGPMMAMDPELRDTIERIEYVYKRY